METYFETFQTNGIHPISKSILTSTLHVMPSNLFPYILPGTVWQYLHRRYSSHLIISDLEGRMWLKENVHQVNVH